MVRSIGFSRAHTGDTFEGYWDDETGRVFVKRLPAEDYASYREAGQADDRQHAREKMRHAIFRWAVSLN